MPDGCTCERVEVRVLIRLEEKEERNG